MNMTNKKLFQNDKKKTKILKKQAEDTNKNTQKQKKPVTWKITTGTNQHSGAPLLNSQKMD